MVNRRITIQDLLETKQYRRMSMRNLALLIGEDMALNDYLLLRGHSPKAKAKHVKKYFNNLESE